MQKLLKYFCIIFFLFITKIPVEEYGAQIASTTAIPCSKDMIGVGVFESQIFTVQSADAEINVLGWNVFHFTL